MKKILINNVSPVIEELMKGSRKLKPCIKILVNSGLSHIKKLAHKKYCVNQVTTVQTNTRHEARQLCNSIVTVTTVPNTVGSTRLY